MVKNLANTNFFFQKLGENFRFFSEFATEYAFLFLCQNLAEFRQNKFTDEKVYGLRDRMHASSGLACIWLQRAVVTNLCIN